MHNNGFHGRASESCEVHCYKPVILSRSTPNLFATRDLTMELNSLKAEESSPKLVAFPFRILVTLNEVTTQNLFF